MNARVREVAGSVTSVRSDTGAHLSLIVKVNNQYRFAFEFRMNIVTFFKNANVRYMDQRVLSVTRKQENAHAYWALMEKGVTNATEVQLVGLHIASHVANAFLFGQHL